MGEYTKYLLNEKVQYLKNFCFFKDIPTFQMLQLFHYMKEIKFKKNNIIYSEKEKVKYVYFIREGEVDISKNIEI